MIHLGLTAERKPIAIPIWHTGVFGTSGVGKTSLLKYMLPQAVREGYKVLIIDSKVNTLGGPEFEGIGKDYPFYLQESTDPDIFLSLIEGMRPKGKGNLQRYRGGFIEICDGTETFEDIGKNITKKLNDPKIKGWTKGMYKEIKYDFDKLMALLGKEKFSKTFDIRDPVVRIPTYRLPNLALQGLVVRSIVEEILAHYARTIILVDEAQDFCPQQKYSPAKDALAQLDQKGRSSENWGWYSAQTLTRFDKGNFKNLWYWVLGREMQNSEAKDVWETQATKVYSQDYFRTLKVRHFIVSTPDFTTEIEVPLIQEEHTLRYQGGLLAAKELALARLVEQPPEAEDNWDDVMEKVEEVRAWIRTHG